MKAGNFPPILQNVFDFGARMFLLKHSTPQSHLQIDLLVPHLVTLRSRFMSDASAWTGAEDAPTKQSRENAVKCDAECDWAAALHVCSSLRDGVACKLEGDYSLGTRKLARKVRFDDNVCWVICVWMNRSTNCELGFKSEAATCRFLW